MWLLLAFVAVPMIEIGLFIQVGGLIGLWPTLAIVLGTAVAGTWLVRTQGALAMHNLRQSFAAQADPTEPLAHGAMILVAGVLLLTPGFFTDSLGLALLMPPFRRATFAYLRSRVKVQSFNTEMHRHPHQNNPGGSTIEGDFHEVETPSNSNGAPSGWTKH